MFRVVGELNKEELQYNMLERTRHVNERLWRLKNGLNLDTLSKEDVYKIFIVDRQSDKGLEIHIICNNATVLVVGHRTNKFITIMNEGVCRLKRYEGHIPKFLYDNALKNSIENQKKFSK